ncbi:PREDICTED: uncharacterized protein LOC108618385 [Drosophila arizonae]|uniref:Uncharacterized protein LOC108618385 n=1 Tax=Drosophila arizonae TaxID=7263 RepID=A0ABM1PRN2_DROAR|nr:PREDICTED: uncharacterized protein LOC108618385 [Drosophila arizonae]
MSGKCHCSGPTCGGSGSLQNRQGSQSSPCPCRKCKEKAKALLLSKGSNQAAQCSICRVHDMQLFSNEWSVDSASHAGSNQSDCHCGEHNYGMGHGHQSDYWEYKQPGSSHGGLPAVAFGGMDYSRKSSVTEGTPRVDIPKRSGCSINLPFVNVDPSLMHGRDTFGLPIHLQGNEGLLNASGRTVCIDHTYCNENCGLNNDCAMSCKHSRKDISKGVHVCDNEYVNAAVTFLIEMLGILVFFAICTFTFWITLGYYIVQLVVDLINADRNVHVAMGTVFVLLVFAFAITVFTHSHGCCHAKASDAIMKGGPSTSCKPSLLPKKRALSKCRPTTLPKPHPHPPHAKPKTPCCAQSNKKSTCSRSFKQRYSDCQGRKIFDRSRRSAILTEMKQPPTWLIWLRESVNGFFCRR